MRKFMEEMKNPSAKKKKTSRSKTPAKKTPSRVRFQEQRGSDSLANTDIGDLQKIMNMKS